jgi:hypothetical protein
MLKTIVGVTATALLAVSLSMLPLARATAARAGAHCGPKTPKCTYSSNGEMHGNRQGDNGK